MADSTDNVVLFPGKLTLLPRPTEELKRAVFDAVCKSTGPGRPEGLSLEDTFLAQLWADGFKVVAVDDEVKP